MDKVLFKNHTGTPQGGVISPLLANIYLNKLDTEMKRRGHLIIRYADDLVVLCKSKSEAERAMQALEEILQSLKLHLNKRKTKIRNSKEDFTFLGHEINHWRLRPTNDNIDKFKDKVRVITRRSLTRPISAIIPELNRVICGWGHYFKIGKVTTIFNWLDSFVRNRVRIYIFKRRRAADYYKLSDDEINKMGVKSLASILSGATLQESRMR
jgi:hypothetical protein